MVFIFIDESGDTAEPGVKLPNGTWSCAFFALGGIAIDENRIRSFDSRLYGLKKSFYGEKKYAEHHHELKSDQLFGPKYICNEERQRFSRAITFLLRELDAKLFITVFDKRKANLFKDNTDDKDGKTIKNWFYGLGYNRLLPVIDDYLNTVSEYGEKGIIVSDKHNLDEKLSEDYLKYTFGNIQGKQLNNICKFSLYGVSKDVAGLQWADFATGVIRYYFEYEYASGVRLTKPNDENYKRFEENFRIVRKQMYYRKIESEESPNGFIQVF
jgi:hypothetical protein